MFDGPVTQDQIVVLEELIGSLTLRMDKLAQENQNLKDEVARLKFAQSTTRVRYSGPNKPLHTEGIFEVR